MFKMEIALLQFAGHTLARSLRSLLSLPPPSPPTALRPVCARAGAPWGRIGTLAHACPVHSWPSPRVGLGFGEEGRLLLLQSALCNANGAPFRCVCIVWMAWRRLWTGCGAHHPAPLPTRSLGVVLKLCVEEVDPFLGCRGALSGPGFVFIPEC